MRIGLVLAVSCLLTLSAQARDLSCGFGENLVYRPNRFDVVNVPIEKNQTDLKIALEDFRTFEISYFKNEGRLNIKATTYRVLTHLRKPYVNRSSILLPYDSEKSYMAAITNPKFPNVALHCWLQN